MIPVVSTGPPFPCNPPPGYFHANDLRFAGPVQIVVGRLDARRAAVTAVRADGMTVQIPSGITPRGLPRELAHFAVEDTLEVRTGFWGSIALGALLSGMQVVEGGEPVLAADRARDVNAATARTVEEAEALVAAFAEIVDRGLDARWPQVEPRLQSLAARRGARLIPLNKTDVVRVAAAWRDLQARWDQVPIGWRLELVWQTPLASGNWPAIK
jgi:hypothetical protein